MLVIGFFFFFLSVSCSQMTWKRCFCRNLHKFQIKIWKIQNILFFKRFSSFLWRFLKFFILANFKHISQYHSRVCHGTWWSFLPFRFFINKREPIRVNSGSWDFDWVIQFIENQRSLFLRHEHVEFLMDSYDLLKKNIFEFFNLTLISLIDIFEFLDFNVNNVHIFHLSYLGLEIWVLIEYPFMLLNKVLILLL